jgi:nucleoid-associated protein YgaU
VDTLSVPMLNIDHRTTPTDINITVSTHRARISTTAGGTMSNDALDLTPSSGRIANRRTEPQGNCAPEAALNSAREDQAGEKHEESTWRGVLGLLTLGVALAAAAGTLGVRTWQVGTGLGSALFPIEDIVELAAVAVGTVVAGRVGLHALVALACVLADRRGLRWVAGERAVARHAPALVRRLARAAAGAGLGLALAAPTAMALPDALAAPVAADAGLAVVLDLSWQPTGHPATSRPSRTPERASLVNRRQRTGIERDPLVVIEPGDTLWAIAAERLAAERPATEPRTTGGGTGGAHGGTEAPSDAEIAAAVGQWHHANRQVLGSNPDLIRPGTVLHLP